MLLHEAYVELLSLAKLPWTIQEALAVVEEISVNQLGSALWE